MKGRPVRMSDQDTFTAPDDTGGSFPCDECDKTCKTSHALRMHKRFSHNAEADRPAEKAPGRPRAGSKRFTAPRAPRTAGKTSDGALRAAAEAWVVMCYGMTGGVLAQVAPDWGHAVVQCSNEQMVTAWVGLAKRHRVIRDLLLSGEGVSAYAMFVAAHQPLIQLAQSKVMAGFTEPEPPDPMGRPAPGSPAENEPPAGWKHSVDRPGYVEPAGPWPDAA
jgi:hypothetical protein